MNISLIGWSHLGSLIVKNLRRPWLNNLINEWMYRFIAKVHFASLAVTLWSLALIVYYPTQLIYVCVPWQKLKENSTEICYDPDSWLPSKQFKISANAMAAHQAFWCFPGSWEKSILKCADGFHCLLLIVRQKTGCWLKIKKHPNWVKIWILILENFVQLLNFVKPAPFFLWKR